MHGLFFILFIPILIIAIIINIVSINYRRKGIISFIKNILYNLILFTLCIVFAVIILEIILSFHDEIGCVEISNFEPAILFSLIFIPIANSFYIKKIKTTHNS